MEPAEEEKVEADDNAQTIRPTRSPQGLAVVPLPLMSLPEKPERDDPFVDDYSDLVIDEDDLKLQAKVADFKVRLLGQVCACEYSHVAR